MKTINLHNKQEIESYLRKNTLLHIYSLGDLDTFFWPYTTWYASKEADQIHAILLVYSGMDIPTLLAFSDDKPALRSLLESTLPLLPRYFYMHILPDLEDIFTSQFSLEFRGDYYKMGLQKTELVTQVDTSRVSALGQADLEQIYHLYSLSYPGNWFDPRMLETRQYFGVKGAEELLSIAGVHVYSAPYKAAALGNITTHPAHRGQGLGKITTARLCQSLLETVDYIGLNVKANNQAALNLYQMLGFEIVSPYREYTVRSG